MLRRLTNLIQLRQKFNPNLQQPPQELQGEGHSKTMSYQIPRGRSMKQYLGPCPHIRSITQFLNRLQTHKPRSPPASESNMTQHSTKEHVPNAHHLHIQQPRHKTHTQTSTTRWRHAHITHRTITYTDEDPTKGKKKSSEQGQSSDTKRDVGSATMRKIQSRAKSAT